MRKMINILPNEQLKRERLRRGWSRLYVAEQIGVADPKTIGRWERGVAFPSSYFLQKLCSLFGMPAQDLGLFPVVQHTTLHSRIAQTESGWFSQAHPHELFGTGNTALVREGVHGSRLQRRVSDGILWTSLGLQQNLADLLGIWGNLLGRLDSEIPAFQEEVLD